MEYAKDLSIIIPLFNEEESLGELLAWIKSVTNAEGYNYEVIFVDDGSTDGSWAKIKEFCKDIFLKIKSGKNKTKNNGSKK